MYTRLQGYMYMYIVVGHIRECSNPPPTHKMFVLNLSY